MNKKDLNKLTFVELQKEIVNLFDSSTMLGREYIKDKIKEVCGEDLVE